MASVRQMGWGILGGVIITTLGLLGWQGQTLATARAELRQRRSAAADVARLQAEYRQLMEYRAPPSELERLRANVAELERVRLEIAALKTSAAQSGAAGEATPAATPIIPANAWKRAGTDTPAAAVETAVWAAAGGDIEALVGTIGFEPRLKASLERAFATLPENVRQQYGSAEQMVAFFTVKDVPLGDMQIVQERQLGEGEKEITVRLRAEDQKSTKEVALTLKRSDGGWRLMVPPLPVQKYFDVIGGALAGAPGQRKRAKAP